LPTNIIIVQIMFSPDATIDKWLTASNYQLQVSYSHPTFWFSTIRLSKGDLIKLL